MARKLFVLLVPLVLLAGACSGDDKKDDAAEVIGVKPAELAKDLRAGKSVAEVAEAKGVDRQAVVDALVKDGSARIDAAVKAGKLPADRAAKAKARLAKAVDRLVDAHRKH